MYALAKPADFEFSRREKVLRLAEQQGTTLEGQLSSARTGDLFIYARPFIAVA